MPEPIFRTIEVGVDQHITLGETLTPDVRALMTPSDPDATQLQMRVGTFGNAESITVDLSPADKTVQEIEFTYAPGTSYDEELTSYTELLGPPNPGATVPDTQQSAVWRDPMTKFELWEAKGNVGSQLTNVTGA